jgi:hypothetical protein
MSAPRRVLAELREGFRFLPPVVREALVEHAGRAGLAGEPANRIFEHFAAYHVLRSAGLDEFDASATLVAGENDTQLDAVAVTINGRLVTGQEEVDDLVRDAIDGEPFEVRFLFAQATMSSKFPSDKVALYTTGVLNFFLPKSELRQSESLIRTRTLKDRVLSALATLGRGRAEADVFVVWPGTWTTEGHEEHATGVAEAALRTLKATGVLDDVRFHRIDSTRLQTLVVDDRVANVGEMALEGLAELPAIAGVGFACIGFVSAFDYLSCLSDGDPAAAGTNLKEDVFHGNVRAFLGGDMRINRHIRDSIVGGGGAAQAEFALRNNGVTIIAEDAVRLPGTTRLRLRNFQVVNGCQTSHVLFHNRAHLTPALMLPIKVIATREPQIAQNIILGLNRQTQIDELQILARNDFVRRLKRHCDVTPAARALWIEGQRVPLILFERRTGEYRHIREKDRTRVVTLQEMMQVYAAAFLESPHSVHDGGKEYLLRQVPRRMFADDHDVGFYFASALLLWRVRQALPSLRDWQGHPAKHHLVFALRTLADPSPGCPTGRRDGEAHEYLRALRETLFDDKAAQALAARAVEIVSEAAQRYAADHGTTRAGPVRPTSAMAQREAFSDHVLALCLAEGAGP